MAELPLCKRVVEGSSPFPSSTFIYYMHKKTKGYIAEMAVASRFLRMGWRVLFPFGENNRYDLVAEKDGEFVRIQVKYVTPRNGALDINCRSSNNWSVDKYTTKQIDTIAVYDSKNCNIYFVPSARLNSSRIKLRIKAAKNKQRSKINKADDFLFFK